MGTYSYDARDRSGNPVSGIIEATEPRGAADALREQGLLPSRIEAVTGTMPSASFATAPNIPSTPTLPPPAMGKQAHIDPAPFLVSVPIPELAMMYRQMATLINAGVPLVQATSTLATQTRNGRLKSIMTECSQAVAGGSPLSSVMERHPGTFDTMQMEMIRAGELSGALETMCSRIADYLERETEIRRKLKRETLYPKIVLAVAWLVGGILIFVRAGGGGGVGGYLKFSLMMVVLTGGAWWLARYLNQFAAFGAIWDNVKMLIPGPGGVARKYATARFTRALGTLYSSGVLLPKAVEIAARACGNRAIGQTLLDNTPALYNGGGIAGMLAQSGLLSPIAVQMARTGEQTGNLDQMMDKVADYLESEADTKSHQLAVFAGVGALLFAAVIVGFIAVSAYTGQANDVFKATDGE